jgi:hypothetical protein
MSAEEDVSGMELTEDQAKAAVKIQAMARGRQTRAVLNQNSLDGARVIFAERQAMRDRDMDASQLARTNKPGEQDGRTAQADREVVEAAAEYHKKVEMDEERAAISMQSLYRGFRDRRQVRAVRENAESTARNESNRKELEHAKAAEAALHMQSKFHGETASTPPPPASCCLRPFPLSSPFHCSISLLPSAPLSVPLPLPSCRSRRV